MMEKTKLRSLEAIIDEEQKLITVIDKSGADSFSTGILARLSMEASNLARSIAADYPYGEAGNESSVSDGTDDKGLVTVRLSGNVLCVTGPLFLARTSGAAPGYVKRYYETLYYDRIRDAVIKTGYTADAPFVLWYRHCYEDLGKQGVRDHDNMETKLMTDMLTRLLGVDDTPILCSTYVSSAVSIPERTECYFIPKDEFAGVLTDVENDVWKGKPV